jgi:hypothetical protein
MFDENLDRPVWGIPAIAKIAGLTEKAARYKVRAKHLKVGKVGGRYVSTPREILVQMAAQSRKAEGMTASAKPDLRVIRE